MAGAMFESEERGLPLLRRGKVRDVYEPSAEHLHHRRVRPHLGLRQRAAHAHPRQGQDPHPDLQLLVREDGAHHPQPHRRPQSRARSGIPISTGTTPSSTGARCWCASTEPLVIEAIVRGYLSGSGWKEYQKSGHGVRHPAARRPPESDKLPEAIFTPSTKAQAGHDENISFEKAAALVGADVAAKVRDTSLALYQLRRRLRAASGASSSPTPSSSSDLLGNDAAS